LVSVKPKLMPAMIETIRNDRKALILNTEIITINSKMQSRTASMVIN
jgi:hypothetical protein